jgi:hypothetical protein
MGIIGGANNNVLKPVTEVNVNGLSIDQLILYYDAARPYSYPKTGAVWHDLSGTGTAADGFKTGSIVNGTTFSTAGGGSLIFDGTDDQVKIDQGTNTTNPIYLGAGWTATFWIKTTVDGGLFSHWSGGPVGLALSITSGKMNFYYYDGQWNSGPATTGTTVTTGNWISLTWVRPISNTDPVLMYVNNVLDFSLNPRISWGSYQMGNIGAYWSHTFFNGSIGNVMVHNKVLTETERTRNYNILRQRFY